MSAITDLDLTRHEAALASAIGQRIATCVLLRPPDGRSDDDRVEISLDNGQRLIIRGYPQTDETAGLIVEIK